MSETVHFGSVLADGQEPPVDSVPAMYGKTPCDMAVAGHAISVGVSGFPRPSPANSPSSGGDVMPGTTAKAKVLDSPSVKAQITNQPGNMVNGAQAAAGG